MPSSVSVVAERGSPAADIEVARRVLLAEKRGLEALAASLDASFAAAIEVFAAVRGRVVVTGMGKSGHVARKIAATLASTGTPAQFVHPGEASHGDLGMIASGDAVLALSNSGETAELDDIIAYATRFRIPLVAMTRRAKSVLAEAADVALVLPATEEACPLGLAPTTSTTMMLALGDAIAVALLERKGFSSDDFKIFHPGGRLGRRLLRVAEIMHAGDAVPLVPRGTPMSEAVLVMTAKSFGCVGVTQGGRLAGIVTDGDLRRHMEKDLLARPVEEVMTANPKTIDAGALAAEALAIMNEHAITSLMVVDEERRPQGILHIHDCLRAGVA
ncbi:MAG: KpsF/GutQ family sugar-phosphate isomerase [Rhodospirillales bacterium]|nr:KpsF/GutQ family sugar-phosphate isomerase [Rhodospirillales bacterium]